MSPARLKVVVFSCQWSPHYCFQTLYRQGRKEGNSAVRILTTCVGRVGADLVLEAFRQGAAGVWVLGCPADLCRHGLSTEEFQKNMRRLRKILDMLGVPKDRLVVKTYYPHQGEKLVKELEGFSTALGAATGK